MRVALAHDWLTGMRGGERVLEAFCELFPAAPLATLLHVQGRVAPRIEQRRIVTSPLQRLPGAARLYRRCLPFYPELAARVRVPACDLLLSDSSCVAKAFATPPGAVHACYVHSPMRYLYDRYDDYFGPGRCGLATRWAMRCARGRLRRWDRATAAAVHAFACNSTFVRDRIRACYGRDATVIAPPVDVRRFAALRGPIQGHYLMVAALVPYKNVDVAVEAFRRLPGRRLVVAGDGPWLARLRAAAPPNVTLRGWVDDAERDALLTGCRAFIMPNVEDFGIAPVEAQAAGRPVIALGAGGVLDSLRDLDRWNRFELPGPEGPTGLLYQDPSPAGLAAAVKRFEALREPFRAADCRAHAARFGTERFLREIAAWLEGVLAVHRPELAAAWRAGPLLPAARAA